MNISPKHDEIVYVMIKMLESFTAKGYTNLMVGSDNYVKRLPAYNRFNWKISKNADKNIFVINNFERWFNVFRDV